MSKVHKKEGLINEAM